MIAVPDISDIMQNSYNYIWTHEDLTELLEMDISDDKSFVVPKAQSAKRVKLISAETSAIVDRGGVSNRTCSRVISSVAKNIGLNIHQLNVSYSAIRRQRERQRLTIADGIKKNFQASSKSIVLQVQWDGKQMPDTSNSRQNVDRLPVIVSGNGIEQLLAIPKLTHGTGQAMAVAITNLLRDWNIPFDMIGGMVFDTTSSNTGGNNGACILLEQLLKKKLLYFACRHHVYEIILRAAYEHFMGGTSGPDVLLFKRFHKS